MITKRTFGYPVIQQGLILAKNHMVTKPYIPHYLHHRKSYSSKKSYGNKTHNLPSFTALSSYSSKKSYGNKTVVNLNVTHDVSYSSKKSYGNKTVFSKFQQY